MLPSCLRQGRHDCGRFNKVPSRIYSSLGHGPTPDGLPIWRARSSAPVAVRSSSSAMRRDANRPRCYESPMFPWGNIVVLVLSLLGWSCAQNPYAQEGNPSGFNQDEAERDYRECEYKARLANDQHLYSQYSLF